MTEPCGALNVCRSALCLGLLLLTVVPGTLGKEKSQPGGPDGVIKDLGNATMVLGGSSGGAKNPPTSGAEETASDTTKAPSSSPTEQTNVSVDTSRITQQFDPISAKILRGQVDGIWVSDLVLDKPQVFINQSGFMGYSVDYHHEKKLLVYIAFGLILKDKVVSRLVRVNDKLPTTLVSVKGPTRLAVDWLHDRVYWMGDAYQAIEAIGLDGSNRTTIVDSLPHFEYPNNLAVDPYKGYLFFVSNHAIFRSDLEGESLMQLRPSLNGERGVKCLTLDVPNKKLYFSGKSGNAKTGRPFVASCGYDGEQAKVHELHGTWNDIYSLAVFRDTLHFAHYENGHPDTIYSASLGDNQLAPSARFSSGLNQGIWSITIYHPDKQKENEDDG